MIRRCLAMFALALALAFAGPARAESMRIPETDLVFDAPAGFTALSPAELQAKFPARNPPRYAVGNAGRTTTIVYDLRDVAATDEALAAQVDAIGTNLARVIPGFVRIEQGVRRLHGKQWVYLELTSTAIDTDIHNIMLMGVHDGRLLVVNFNATRADFANLEAQIRASVASLRPLAAMAAGPLRVHVWIADPIPRVLRSQRYGRPLKAWLVDSGLGEVVGENTTLSRTSEPTGAEFDVDFRATEEAIPTLVAELKALGAPPGSVLTFKVGDDQRRVPIQ